MKISKNKKAAFFSPYLNTLGGGERYFFSVIKWAHKKNFQIQLFWPDDKIIDLANQRFGFDLKGNEIKINSSGYTLLTKGSFWDRVGLLDNFDFIFFVSDGSIPFFHSSSFNLVHFQVPFLKVKKGWSWFIKKKNISYFVYNSQFTQNIIQPQLNKLPSVIIYPPVDTVAFHTNVMKKKKIILAVGRFDQTMQAKRQDLLISVFKLMFPRLSDWKLVLAGGSTNPNYWIKPLKKLAKGYPIDFIINPSWEKLKELYLQASLFWHAAGFGINEKKYPEKMEHFGITTVEALAAGCIPIVYNGGGLPEIIQQKKNGFLFSTRKELIDFTFEALKNQEKFTLSKLRNSVQKFSQENFYKNLDDLWQEHIKIIKK